MGFFTPISVKPAAKGAAPDTGTAAPADDSAAAAFLAPLPAASASGPTPGQLARTLWSTTPGWQKPLMFVGQGLNAVGTGIDHLLGVRPSGAPPKANFGRYAAPAPQQPAPGVNAALDAQHPWYNYGVKWPTELGASLPLGEGAGMGAGALMDAAGPTLADDAPLWQRALYALPRSMATGAAYGVQQPTGHPLENAAIGAIANPVLEGTLHGALELGGKGAEAIGGLWRGITRSVPDQAELDARVGNYLRSVGAPSSVTARPTPEGVALTTAAHANDPNLLDLQGKERAGQRAVPFHELATQNDAAIVNGLRQHLAPQPDSNTVSSAAHDLLQSAQARGRAAVRAAYQPFDEAKGSVYLERGPVQKALREAYDGLLPAQREVLPAKVREVMEADHPLHLMTDVEDLGARLSDAIGAAPRGTPTARSLLIMRDALNEGMEGAPLANQAERGALSYDPARASLPRRNTVEPDATQDSILQYLAKHGKGIDSAEGEAQGLDPADMRSSAARVGIRRAFRQGGLSFDQAAEELHQAGYPVADARGNYDPNVLLNHIDSELHGRPVYSAANTRQAAEVAHEAATAATPAREPPDLTDLTTRALQANPERAQAILDGWTDDRPETLARVQGELHAVADPPQAPADATELWKNAKAANKAFRDRFPQGTARDSEARGWLSKWLSGRKDPGRFLTEATVLPSRAKAVLDALDDQPEAQDQMRQMMRNHYVNRLLSNTRASVPGERLLNADALTRARSANAAIERVLLKPNEADLLDRYVGAVRDNGKILQRSINGSSETASLLQHQGGKADELLGSGIVHAAAKVHPVAGALAHMLLPRGAGDAAAEALQSTLTNALLDPGVYNRVMGAETPESVFLKLLRGAGRGAIAAAPRAAAFTLPAGIVPVLSGTR